MSPAETTLAVGLGDAILDIIVHVSATPERLRELGVESLGGCVQVASAQIDALLDALSADGGGAHGGSGDGERAHRQRPQG